MTGRGAQRGPQDRGAAEDRARLRGAETRERPLAGQCLACSLHDNTKGHCHPRASSAKTRGFHTQLDEGPETP